MCRIENNTFFWKWKFLLHCLYPRWSYKYRNQEEPERMVACKLKSFYIPGNYHGGNLEKTNFFQPILEFTLKIAPNQKTLLRCKGRPRSAMKWNHIWDVMFQMAAHSWARAAWPTHWHFQQQQEMSNHTLNTVKQIWPWGTGQVRAGLEGKGDKISQKQSRRKKQPGERNSSWVFAKWRNNALIFHEN